MLLKVALQGFLRAKRSDASSMRANELLHSSVDDEEVVDEVLVGGAVDTTLRAHRLADVRLQMRQQMQAILVGVGVERLAAEAATFHARF